MSLDKIAEELKDSCCASLLGTERKVSILAELRAIEAEQAELNRYRNLLIDTNTQLKSIVDRHEEEIVELKKQVSIAEDKAISLAREVFDATYKDTRVGRKQRMWLQLCVELGIVL